MLHVTCFSLFLLLSLLYSSSSSSSSSSSVYFPSLLDGSSHRTDGLGAANSNFLWPLNDQNTCRCNGGNIVSERNGNLLPGPREISNVLFAGENNVGVGPTSGRRLSSLFTFFGQAIVEDISTTKTSNEERVDIPIPVGDPVFDPLSRLNLNVNVNVNTPTLMFYRSAYVNRTINITAVTNNTKNNSDSNKTGSALCIQRLPVNLNSGFLDASNVYGVNSSRLSLFRSLSGGTLFVQQPPPSIRNKACSYHQGGYFPNYKWKQQEEQELGGNYTSNANTISDSVLLSSSVVNLIPRLNSSFLFRSMSAGSVLNEDPGAMSIATIFLREHNRRANIISLQQPHWTDEQIFQEARKWIIGHMQSITFNEYAVLLFGRNPFKPYSGFKPGVDPSTSVLYSFAGARYGHSELSGSVKRVAVNHVSSSAASTPRCPFVSSLNDVDASYSLEQVFFNVLPLLTRGEDEFEEQLLGLVNNVQQEVDSTIVNEMRDGGVRGFKGYNGVDIAATNVQRGRDMCLPSYNEARALFGLPRASSFQNISSSAFTVNALATLYVDVDDVDLYVGGISEDHVPGSNLGPLFEAIIIDQLVRVRDGDPFWFGNYAVNGLFNASDYAELVSTKFSTIIARNTNIGQVLPDSVFEAPLSSETSLVSPASPSTTDSVGLPVIIQASQDDVVSILGQYMASLQITPDYQFYWTIDTQYQWRNTSSSSLSSSSSSSSSFSTVTVMHAALRVLGNGWAGFGIPANPYSGMVGADFIVGGHISTSATETKIDIDDFYSLAYNRPIRDVASGGVDNLFNTNVTFTADNVMIIRFSRLLVTGDSHDNPISFLSPQVFIYAYNPSSPYFTAHGANRGHLSIDLSSGVIPTCFHYTSAQLAVMTVQQARVFEENCAEIVALSQGQFAAVCTMSAFVFASSVAIMIWLFLNHDQPVVRTSSLHFNLAMTVGGVLLSISLLLLALDASRDSQLCMARLTCGHVAYSLIAGSIFIRSWRINKIFNSDQLAAANSKHVTSTFLVMMRLGVILLVQLLIIVIWAAEDPLTTDVNNFSYISSSSPPVKFIACSSSSSVYFIILLAYEVALLIWGIVLVIQIRNLPSTYNEAKYITISIYIIAAFSLVFATLLFASNVLEDPRAFIVISAVAITCSYTGVFSCMFGSKIMIRHQCLHMEQDGKQSQNIKQKMTSTLQLQHQIVSNRIAPYR